jgi:DNA-binding NtrC family response regulator
VVYALKRSGPIVDGGFFAARLADETSRKRAEAMAATSALRRQAIGKSGHAQLVGVSQQIVQLHEEIERVARTDATILITGERGVGKETVARCIHDRSARASRPFLTVNCEGLPESLLESELFGHVRGSFTGAFRDNPGRLELADEGSVFLDEIGEMTLRMQERLLRLLETGALRKLGADDSGRAVNVRVIAATNRNLLALIRDGRFREDLFNRLNEIHLVVPPLRERPEDIPVLVNHFLHTLTRESGCTVSSLDGAALKVLMRYGWPGNVRQLANVLEWLARAGQAPVATTDDLPPEVRTQQNVTFRPKRERRRTIADDLYRRLTEESESFWALVYTLYMDRQLTRRTLREVIRMGLEHSRGNYRIVARLFNIDARDYKRFLNFLRKHDCQLPFKVFRM